MKNLFRCIKKAKIEFENVDKNTNWLNKDLIPDEYDMICEQYYVYREDSTLISDSYFSNLLIGTIHGLDVLPFGDQMIFAKLGKWSIELDLDLVCRTKRNGHKIWYYNISRFEVLYTGSKANVEKEVKNFLRNMQRIGGLNTLLKKEYYDNSIIDF